MDKRKRTNNELQNITHKPKSSRHTKTRFSFIELALLINLYVTKN